MKRKKRKKKKRECLEGFGDEGYDMTIEQRRMMRNSNSEQDSIERGGRKQEGGVGKTVRVYPTCRHLEINDFMNDSRPLYQSACVSQTDLSHQESPWLLFLTRGGWPDGRDICNRRRCITR